MEKKKILKNVSLVIIILLMIVPIFSFLYSISENIIKYQITFDEKDDNHCSIKVSIKTNKHLFSEDLILFNEEFQLVYTMKSKNNQTYIINEKNSSDTFLLNNTLFEYKIIKKREYHKIDIRYNNSIHFLPLISDHSSDRAMFENMVEWFLYLDIQLIDNEWYNIWIYQLDINKEGIHHEYGQNFYLVYIDESFFNIHNISIYRYDDYHDNSYRLNNYMIQSNIILIENKYHDPYLVYNNDELIYYMW